MSIKPQWPITPGCGAALCGCVLALQGSAAASSRPSSARSRSFMATAQTWGQWSRSSAPPSTSWRDRASSPAFGKGTARSGQPECPPASVRFFPNRSPSFWDAVGSFCPAYLCNVRIHSRYLCKQKDKFNFLQSCPTGGSSTP